MEAVRFYYDVVCPYSYMESHAVEAAEDDGLLAVEWLPYELRPAPARLLEVRGDHLRVDWTRHVYRRALERGIEIHLPRFQPRSTLVLAACLWAGAEGRLRAFKHALYEAFFCEGVDIATDAEIARCAEIAGLAGEEAVAVIRRGFEGAAAEQEEIRTFVQQLDSPRFALREAATAGLIRYGSRSLPALREAMAKGPSVEARGRIELVLRGLSDKGVPTAEEGVLGEELRTVRTVQVLERVGGEAAKALLGQIAGGEGEAAREARAVLGVWGRRR